MSANSVASAKSLQQVTEEKRSIPDYPSGPDLLESAASLAKKDLNSVHSLKSNRSNSKASVTSSQKSTSVRPVSRTSSRTTVPSRTSNASKQQVELSVHSITPEPEPEINPVVSAESDVQVQED